MAACRIIHLYKRYVILLDLDITAYSFCDPILSWHVPSPASIGYMQGCAEVFAPAACANRLQRTLEVRWPSAGAGEDQDE